MDHHEENILAFLTGITEPVDVEKIRVACQIGNWNTALKHCLDLLLQGKIRGQKTSKGWVFWTRQNVQLTPWEEAVGTLDRVEEREAQTVAYLTCIVKKQIAFSLPKDDLETKKLPKLVGQKIAILRTDDPKKPIIIRTISVSTVAETIKSSQLQLRRCLSSSIQEIGCFKTILVQNLDKEVGFHA